MTDVGTHLKAARKEHGWSLREAERRSGVPNAHISQIETGAIRQPGIAVLIRLATAYEIPLSSLLALAGHASFGTLLTRWTSPGLTYGKNGCALYAVRPPPRPSTG